MVNLIAKRTFTIECGEVKQMYLLEWLVTFFGVLGLYEVRDKLREMPLRAPRSPSSVMARQLADRAFQIIGSMASSTGGNQEIATWLSRYAKAYEAIAQLLADAQQIFIKFDAPVEQIEQIRSWMTDYQQWKGVTS